MPNYSLTINSQFRPFTYQELAAPLDRQDAYHEHLMEQYEKLSSQADILEAMGANDRDNKSGAYSQFKAYSDNLRNERDLLYKHGLDPNSRLRLAEMRRRYNTEIVPIQNAWTKREQEADMQMKAQMQNPSLRFTRDARTSTLDSYIANPTGGFGVVNLNAISADMAAMAKSLEGKIKRGEKVDGIDSVTYNYIQQYGLDESTINRWLKDPQSNPTLTNMKNQVLAKHGVTAEALQGSDNAISLMKEAENAANMGAWASIGKDTSQLHEDRAKVMAMQHYYHELEAENDMNRRIRAAKETQGGGATVGGDNMINPLPLRAQNELDENNKTIRKYIDNGYFTLDSRGRYRMTSKGFDAMRNQKNPSVGTASAVRDKEFYDFMVGLNGGKSFLDKNGKALPGWGPGRAGDVFNKFVQANKEGSYDTYHTTEYKRVLGSEYQKPFTQQVLSAAYNENGKGTVSVVKFNGKKGWDVIDKLSAKDLKDYTVTDVRYSKYGNTAIMQKEGEEPIRVLLPKTMNLGADRNVAAAIFNADEFGSIINKRKRPVIENNVIKHDRNGNIVYTNEDLTPEDIIELERHQRNALNEMESYGSQLVVPSTTEAAKYNWFGF